MNIPRKKIMMPQSIQICKKKSENSMLNFNNLKKVNNQLKDNMLLQTKNLWKH